ncbi:DUF92 domain-containing protein [Thermoplasmatales archaeon AK]|nr:DUF92 domain-containing protein [Thermoplasmatales archaeon AK]
MKGSIAALVLGVIVSFFGSLNWLILLVIFAVSSHIATKMFFDEKKKLKLQEGRAGERRFSNVFYAGIIALAISSVNFFAMTTKMLNFNLFALFASSLAVIASDTFGSEIGVMDRNVYMITTMRKVPPGVNGGISVTGELSAMLGSFIVAISYSFLRTSGFDLFLFLVVFVSGFFGCHIDSLLGALLENKGLISKGAVNLLASVSGVALAGALIASSHII